MPAALVIRARAYIKVVAIKKLLVGFVVSSLVPLWMSILTVSYVKSTVSVSSECTVHFRNVHQSGDVGVLLQNTTNYTAAAPDWVSVKPSIIPRSTSVLRYKPSGLSQLQLQILPFALVRVGDVFFLGRRPAIGRLMVLQFEVLHVSENVE